LLFDTLRDASIIIVATSDAAAIIAAAIAPRRYAAATLTPLMPLLDTPR